MKNEKSIEPLLLARKIINDYHIDTDKEVELSPLLLGCNVLVREKLLPVGIDGECVNKGLNRLIIINERITNPRRKRFTVAHEFGHIILKHNTKICKSEYFSLSNTSDDIEYDANRFAAELLLPYNGICKITKHSDLSILLCEKTASVYNTSLLSTSIRLTLIEKSNVSIVLHNSEKIIWAINSENNYQKIINNRIPANPIIKKMKDSDIKYKKEVISAQEWSPDFDEDKKCMQESKFFNRRNEYLTLLTFS